MKVTLTLLALFSFAFAKPNLSDVPTIKVSQARSKGSVPEMQITFADGHEDKLVLHRHFISGADRMMDEEMCNYLGHLENDATACVAVTGCIGQDMELTINSKHNTKTNTYLLQKSGEVQLLPRPFSHKEIESISERVPEDIERAFTEVDSDEEIDPDDLADEMQWSAICTSADTSGCSSIPPSNELTIQIGYDDSFRNAFQSQEAANIYIFQLLTHSQAYYCMESLGTKIELKLDSIVYHPGNTWVAENKLSTTTMFQIAKDIPADVDLTPFLSAPDTIAPSSGRGYVGSACKWGGGYRTTITEKQGSIAITAGTFVHELGHNLGMEHDHKEVHEGRGCDGTGFMSYGNHDEKWSDCSRTDLLALYNQIQNHNGWTWCMSEPAQDVCAPTPTDPTTVAPPPPTTFTEPPATCDLPPHKLGWFLDGYCDTELNNAACGYDGGDCCLNKRGSNTNNYCGNECECLGFDCPAYQQHPSWINDKFCDTEFNTPGCFYDSGDCCLQKVENWNAYCGNECTCLDAFHAMIIG